MASMHPNAVAAPYFAAAAAQGLGSSPAGIYVIMYYYITITLLLHCVLLDLQSVCASMKCCHSATALDILTMLCIQCSLEKCVLCYGARTMLAPVHYTSYDLSDAS
jgi:hypothetical protein